jgi:hypothetical protein
MGDSCGRADAGTDVADTSVPPPDGTDGAVETRDAEIEASEVRPDTNPDADAAPDRTETQPTDAAETGPEAPPDVAEVGPDVAEVGSDITEAGPDVIDAGDAADTADGDDGDPGNCHSHVTEPPIMPCRNGHCLMLTEAMRNGLVLWLDPSNLGQAGSDVPIWCDQSGHQNDAYGIDDSFLPIVTRTGGLTLDYNQAGAGLEVGDDPSLNLGSDDFTILVVAGINHPNVAPTLLRKTNADFDFPKQYVLAWEANSLFELHLAGQVNETVAISNAVLTSGFERLYVLRKNGNQVEVRINGVLSGSAPLATSGASTENDGVLFIGCAGLGDSRSVDTLRAAIMIHGSLTDDEVGQLEEYLVGAFNL